MFIDTANRLLTLLLTPLFVRLNLLQLYSLHPGSRCTWYVKGTMAARRLKKKFDISSTGFALLEGVVEVDPNNARASEIGVSQNGY